jgi:4'-phosphopantetheinyl transferase
MAPAAGARVAHWLAQGERDIPATEEWLTPDEAARAGSIRFTKRRAEYLLRRWVCKQAVATAVGLPVDLSSLARIEVTNRPSGAPAVLVAGEDVGFDVSLSDRAGWAVCLVGRALGRLGCDLEIVEPRTAGFVADFLTVTEGAYVASCVPADRDAAANLIWSAKESALKVLQTGLRRDTRSVEVVLAAAGPGTALGGATTWAGLQVRTAEGAVLSGWWRRAGTFLVTTVSEMQLPAPMALTGSRDLDTAEPMHSWMDHPLTE